MNQLEGKFYKLDGISKEDEELIKDQLTSFKKIETEVYTLERI
jgi:hypothetical protein